MKKLYPAVLTFLLAASVEIIIVLDFYAVTRGRAELSALYTGILTFAGTVIVRLYMNQKNLVLWDILGAMFGAWIAVRYFY